MNILACFTQLSVFVVVIMGGYEFIIPEHADRGNKTLPLCRDDIYVNGNTSYLTPSESTLDYVTRVNPTPGQYCRQSSEEVLSRFIWELSVAILFTSLLWWENFVDKNIMCGKHMILPLRIIKTKLQQLRQKSSVLTSVWKIGFTLACPFILLDGFQFSLPSYRLNKSSMPYYGPALINMASGVIGHFCAVIACTLCVQHFSFSLAVTLTTPLCLGIILLQCNVSTLCRVHLIDLYAAVSSGRNAEQCFLLEGIHCNQSGEGNSVWCCVLGVGQ